MDQEKYQEDVVIKKTMLELFAVRDAMRKDVIDSHKKNKLYHIS